MSTSAASLGSSGQSRWSNLRNAVANRWKALAEREKWAVIIAGAVLAIAVVWLVGVQPALRSLREAPAQIDALDAQLLEMRDLAAEAGTLRDATPVSTSQAIAALEAASKQLGSTGRLVVQGDRATLNLNGADTRSLQQWLEIARSAARARPIEMQLVRGPNGYSGSLVLGLGGGR